MSYHRNSWRYKQYKSIQTYNCARCGSRTDVSQVWEYKWYCTVCFREAHRDARKEMESFTEHRIWYPDVFKLANEQYWKEFDTALTSTIRNREELLEETCQIIGSRIARGQVYCDEATAEWARSIFRKRVKKAIKECFENLSE